MKRAALSTTFVVLCVFLFAASSGAQYDIYLKNGSVIEGVGRYKEVNGQVMFQYMGGNVAIPLADIDKIEESRGGARAIGPPKAGRQAAPSIPQAAPQLPPAEPVEKSELKSLKDRLSRINARLEEINKKISEYDEFREEYDQVRLRIEVLFQKGIAKARSKGGDPAKWFEFLDGQERQWAQLNTLKKNKMQKELPEMEKEIAPLLQEKQALLSEKQTVEERIKKLEFPYD